MPRPSARILFPHSARRLSSPVRPFAILLCLALSAAALAAGPTTRRAVVLELFTSEGCSSCPQAERILAALATPGGIRDILIVPLELHVDYFNHLGWADPFSSPGFTQRQKDYAASLGTKRVYTPQLIVDGKREMNGSDKRQVALAVAHAGDETKDTLALEIAWFAPDAGSLGVETRLGSAARLRAPTDLLLAVTEDALASRVTAGENAGRTLTHAGLVRSIDCVETIQAGGASSIRRVIHLDPAWRKENLKLVAFLQERPPGRIRAAAIIRLGLGPDAPTTAPAP